MAQKVGKMIVCDRCGDSVFRECVGEGETDGGYTRWNKFEEAPKGWAYHLDTGTLCPKCNSFYKDIIKSFMNKEPIITFATSDTTSGYVQVDDSKSPNQFPSGDPGEIFG